MSGTAGGRKKQHIAHQASCMWKFLFLSYIQMMYIFEADTDADAVGSVYCDSHESEAFSNQLGASIIRQPAHRLMGNGVRSHVSLEMCFQGILTG